MTLSLFIEQLQELERQGCGHYRVEIEIPADPLHPLADNEYMDVIEVERTPMLCVVIRSL